jgi:hypothetical protein
MRLVAAVLSETGYLAPGDPHIAGVLASIGSARWQWRIGYPNGDKRRRQLRRLARGNCNQLGDNMTVEAASSHPDAGAWLIRER